MGKFYRLNLNITAKTVRVIDEAGKQIGVMDIEEARKKAREAALDLVEIAPKADPPVVRIINFKKFKYLEEKKARSTKKKTKEIQTKEIRLRPTTSDHDIAIRADQAKHFLNLGDRVKLTVNFAGREITHPEFGYKVLEKISNHLAGLAEKDGEPKMIGRFLTLSLKPIKGENKNK